MARVVVAEPGDTLLISGANKRRIEQATKGRNSRAIKRAMCALGLDRIVITEDRPLDAAVTHATKGHDRNGR
jgi:hypothetical protein